jgi:hypothetical protein
MLELEGILNIQQDIEMQTAIENLSNFEYLNDEKITLFFVSFAKCNNATATTDSICDDNGRPFPRNFYANLYKIPENQIPAGRLFGSGHLQFCYGT